MAGKIAKVVIAIGNIDCTKRYVVYNRMVHSQGTNWSISLAGTTWEDLSSINSTSLFSCRMEEEKFLKCDIVAFVCYLFHIFCNFYFLVNYFLNVT